MRRAICRKEPGSTSGLKNTEGRDETGRVEYYEFLEIISAVVIVATPPTQDHPRLSA